MSLVSISDNKYQIDSLDGLRGVAALIVVFSHSSLGGMFFFPGLDLSGIGKTGVYLFFLLSAFLLSIPLLEPTDKNLSTLVISHYFQRRFFRIYPLYFVYLLTAVITTYFFSTILGIADLGAPFVLDINGFASHLLLLEGKGVTWSIAVEFKFYFILPLVLYLLNFTSRISSTASIYLTILLIFVSNYTFQPEFSDVNDPRLSPYVSIFLFGILIAQIYKHYSYVMLKKFTRFQFDLICAVALIGLTLSTPLAMRIIGVDVSIDHFHRDFIQLSILWSICILCSAISTKCFLSKILSIRPLRYLGTVSFSLYLLHPIVIGVIKRIYLDSFLSAWLVLACSILISHFSFKFIEKPFLKTTIFKVK